MRNRRHGFAPVFIVLVVLAVLLAGGWALYYAEKAVAPGAPPNGTTTPPASSSTPPASTSTVYCAQEARSCPDGSFVGRVPPDCRFAPCPGYPGRVECRLDSDCRSGLVCHNYRCVNPISRECNGSSDTSCPGGYRCIQSCGPPVIYQGEQLSPPYYCELNEYADRPRICPICLAVNTKISTPGGLVEVQDIKIGMNVWSLDKNMRKVASTVLTLSRTPAPADHKVVHLVFSDGREIWVSPNHPTADGRIIAALREGDFYDGATVKKFELVGYWERQTYDILPDSDTGYYWADGILLGSSLK